MYYIVVLSKMIYVNFVVITGKLYEMKKVNQIDITPTLAILFGLSIPQNR
jgi:hypothetical protein